MSLVVDSIMMVARVYTQHSALQHKYGFYEFISQTQLPHNTGDDMDHVNEILLLAVKSSMVRLLLRPRQDILHR